jgi:hypothetical protein
LIGAAEFCWVLWLTRNELVFDKHKQKVTLNHHSTKAEGGNQKVPDRSRRIAAQLLAHILTSKWGEVVLMKWMGNLSQATPTPYASKRAYTMPSS